MRRRAAATGAPASALPTAQWKPLEIAFWLLPVAAYFVFPRYLTLGSQIFIAALFALSLDLIMLEHDIRENPADWLWLQKKWKYAKPAAVDAASA